MIRALPFLLALGVAACAVQPRSAVVLADLAPPCSREAAARIRADTSRYLPPPMAAPQTNPPLPASGSTAAELTLRVLPDGRVRPGSVRVSGTDDARYARALRRWAQAQMFYPTTVDGCAIENEASLTMAAPHQH